LPATAPVKYLVITTGDTVESGTPRPTSQAKKGFQRTFAVDNRGVGESSLGVEKGQELLQVMFVSRRPALFGVY
jgi:hypothetical protein